MAGVWRGPRLGKTIPIPHLEPTYDWVIEVGDFDEAWSIAESLSLDSDYPGADALIYEGLAGSYLINLIPQALASNGSLFRFHFGDMIE